MFSKLNDAYDSVKNGLEAQVAVATADEKLKLADAKIALGELKDYISDLKEENRNLKDNLKKRDSVKPEKGHEWLILENDTDSDRRYCPMCYYDRDKLIPLGLPHDWNYKVRRTCKNCNNHFN